MGKTFLHHAFIVITLLTAVPATAFARSKQPTPYPLEKLKKLDAPALALSWAEDKPLARLSDDELKAALTEIEAKAELGDHPRRQLLKILARAVHGYLGGEQIDTDKVALYFSETATSGGIAFPAYTSLGLDQATIFLNTATFTRSCQAGVYESNELSQAQLITLVHEMVHVWLWQNHNAYDALATDAEEGFALFVQTLFAKDHGFQAINVKGIKAFTKVASVSKVLGKDIFSSWFISRWVQNTYYASFNQLAALYQTEDRTDEPTLAKVRRISHAYLSPDKKTNTAK